MLPSAVFRNLWIFLAGTEGVRSSSQVGAWGSGPARSVGILARVGSELFRPVYPDKGSS